MPFEPLVANPGRLRILTALATEPRQEFVRLRERTRLTDGNLATHAKRLHGAGLIAIDKSIRSGKPVTSLELTIAGREALEAHAQHLMSILHPITPHAAEDVMDEPVATAPDDPADDWVD
ncbi:MAG: transcriptional regulator [Tepidisphaeraceae bacterium]